MRALLVPILCATCASADVLSGIDGSGVPTADGVAIADDCAGLPQAMPGWPYYQIWDYDDYRHPFSFRTNEWVVAEGHYERRYVMGRAQVLVQVSDQEGWSFDDIQAVHRLVGRTVAGLPAALTQRLPPVQIQILGNRANATSFVDSPPYVVRFPARYVHASAGPGGSVLLGNTPSHRNFEELLIHELAHVMDAYAAHAQGTLRWSSSTRWHDAMAESPCAVSTYAETSPGEDFAESVVAWFAFYGARGGVLAGDDRRRIRHRLGRRFAVLNRMMHGRFETSN